MLSESERRNWSVLPVHHQLGRWASASERWRWQDRERMHLFYASKISKHSLGNYIGLGLLFFSSFNLSQAGKTHYNSSICYDASLAHGFGFTFSPSLCVASRNHAGL